MKTPSVLFAVAFSVMACYQPQAPPDCDCQSTTYSLLTNKTGVYAKGYVTTVNVANGQPDGFYSLSCNPDFIIGKAVDEDTIILSGRIRHNCFSGETVMVLPGLLELTAARRK